MAKKNTQKFTDYNRIQILLQFHDKGLLSTRTLLESFGLDYDKEVELLSLQPQHISAPYFSTNISSMGKLNSKCCEKPEDCTGCNKVTKTTKTTKIKKKK
jgi:hypothetical protein